MAVSAGASSWMQTAVYGLILVTRSSLLECKYTFSCAEFLSNPTSGGGCTKDVDGNLVLLKDQDESCFITSIINSKEHNVPIGIIIGKSCLLHGKQR